MLILIDDYKAEFPKRNLGVLRKFEDCPKPLNEMSIEEVNQFVSGWGNMAQKTISDYRIYIRLYLDWLADKGYKASWSASDIEFQETEVEFLIYSTEQLHEAWEKMVFEAEKSSARTNIPYNREVFLVTWATDILAFYGLNEEQTLALDRLDVSQNGVEGFDLPLTEKDIKILLEYKNLRRMGNNKRIDGDKYIRSVSGVVSWEVVSRSLRRTVLDPKVAYLRKLLTVNNVYKLGRFADIYNYEKENGEQIKTYGLEMPEFALKQLEAAKGGQMGDNRLRLYKAAYIKYRKERAAYERALEKVMPENPQPINKHEEINEKPQPVVEINVEALVYNRLAVVLQDLDKLRGQVVDLMNMLNEKNK